MQRWRCITQHRVHAQSCTHMKYPKSGSVKWLSPRKTWPDSASHTRAHLLVMAVDQHDLRRRLVHQQLPGSAVHKVTSTFVRDLCKTANLEPDCVILNMTTGNWCWWNSCSPDWSGYNLSVLYNQEFRFRTLLACSVFFFTLTSFVHNLNSFKFPCHGNFTSIGSKRCCMYKLKYEQRSRRKKSSRKQKVFRDEVSVCKSEDSLMHQWTANVRHIHRIAFSYVIWIKPINKSYTVNTTRIVA